MALWSKKEFAAKCGMKTKHLSTYVNRGQIILSGDYIDDSIADNLDFLNKRKDKAAIIEIESVEYPSLEPAKAVKQPVFKRLVSTPVSTSIKTSLQETEKYALEKSIKRAKLEETQINNRIAELKEAKLRGEMMPTELVKSLMIGHSEHIKVAFSDAAENLIVVVGQRKQMTAGEIAEIRTNLVEIINKAVDEAIDNSKKTIKNIVNEYSKRKGVGEKE